MRGEDKGFRCPHCGGKTRVIDSRPSDTIGGDPTLLRRRTCQDCEKRVTTYELLADDYKALFRETDRLKAFAKRIRKVASSVSEGLTA